MSRRLVTIDLLRIKSYDHRSLEYAAGLRYHFTSHTGEEIKCVTKQNAILKLRHDTIEEQKRGELREDAAADGFRTGGKCHVE